MSQTNVNAGGGRVVERDGSGAGFSMGMITAIVLGVVLLALVAWWAIAQSGWFGPAYAPGGSTNVSVTQNQPSSPSGSTTGGSGTTGSTGGTTGGAPAGGAAGGTSGSTGSTTGGSTTGSTAGR